MEIHYPYEVEIHLPHAADLYTRQNLNDLANAIGVWGLFALQNNLTGHSRNHRIRDTRYGRMVTVEVSFNVGSRLRALGGGLIGSRGFAIFQVEYKIRLLARPPGRN